MPLEASIAHRLNHSTIIVFLITVDTRCLQSFLFLLIGDLIVNNGAGLRKTEPISNLTQQSLRGHEDDL